jgi:hypothetical protein
MPLKLDSKRFEQIIQIEDPMVRELQLNEFCVENKLGINGQQILEIAQMVCEVAEVVCPIIEDI